MTRGLLVTVIKDRSPSQDTRTTYSHTYVSQSHLKENERKIHRDSHLCVFSVYFRTSKIHIEKPGNKSKTFLLRGDCGAPLHGHYSQCLHCPNNTACVQTWKWDKFIWHNCISVDLWCSPTCLLPDFFVIVSHLFIPSKMWSYIWKNKKVKCGYVLTAFFFIKLINIHIMFSKR